ncbi:extensin family protein [Microvirga guangxiensis]|uniref:Extensin-like protein C-terminus n=1 Tax=Microvirga guangxiensis TaxID=549386 RepID=A0A1G5L8L9_9HYPH|nr:extensin family protein [Microvirga guangxiensis]SCZ09176.1 Extensin-like protein C-terminus [Microvirga guangxiensis]
MRRGLVAFFALSLVGLGVTGCGLFRFEQREPWRTQAEEACLSQRMVQPSAYMSMSSKIDGPGVCGMEYPFKVAAFNNGEVGLKSKVTLACPIIPRIDTWLDEIVKPAALMYFGVPLVDIKAGSYSCRPRNNRRGAKLSEHSFGNALDVMAFVLADGREITVLKGWRSNPAEQDFLREAFVGACRYFTTVLGPGSDAHHDDHFHIDLARHDARGERRVCKPIIKFTPRIDPERSREILQSVSAQGELPSTELEQDVPVESADGGYAPHEPMGAPMGGPMAPVVSAPVPPPMPRYSGASGNGVPDLYTPPPPPGYVSQAPQQTYAPPRPPAAPMRSSAGQPLVLNRHAGY